MTHREIMQQALDALEYQVKQTRPIEQTSIAITALREALAKPEQEVDYWIRQYSAARDAEMKMRRELAAQRQPLPEWITYDAASDVLVIHGRRYSGSMFGEAGFLSPAGTLLRVEAGLPDLVTLTTVRRQPLTDEQVIEYFKAKVDTGSLLSFAAGVRYAEAAHGITGGSK